MSNPAFGSDHLRSNLSRFSTSSRQREAEVLEVYQPHLNRFTTILGWTTLSLISLRLDPDHLFGRNWIFMAELMGFSNLHIKHVEKRQNRAGKLIESWSCDLHTVGELINLVHRDMERRDVFTDEHVARSILKDVERHQYQQRFRRFSQPNPAPHLPPPSHFTGLNRTVDATTILGRYQRSHSEAPRPLVEPSFFTQLNSSTGTRIMAPFEGSLFHGGPQANLVVSQEPDSTTSLTPKRRTPNITSRQPFDVYILCKPGDAFVRGKLIPMLEQNGVRFCRAECHLFPARNRFNATMDYMLNKSRKIAVVLTDDLMLCQEAEWLGSLALGERRDFFRGRIISIQYKALTKKNVAFGGFDSFDFSGNLSEECKWEQVMREVKPQASSGQSTVA